MADIDIKNLDLNLLVALEQLLRHRSVTRAAEAMGRSQSTISHALARLRLAFEDPLLVPGRGGMVPTPKAEALQAPLGRALAQVRGLWQEGPEFDPQETRRTFSIAAVDAVGALMPELLGWLREEAPLARLRLRQRALGDPQEALSTGDLDLLVDRPPEGGAHLRQASVGRVRWLSYVRAGHPLVQGELTQARWLKVPSVQIITGTLSRSLVDVVLESAGAERQVGAEVPGFLLGLHAVAGSDLMLTGPHILAPLAQGLGLVAIEPPLALPELPVCLLWHERFQRDAAHRWFRQGLLGRMRRVWE